MSIDETELVKEDDNSHTFFWTNSAFDSFREQVVEHQNLSALTSLLNGYRMACHYGAESTEFHDAADSSHKFKSSEAYSKILVFMLSEADNLFRKLIGLSGSNARKEKSSELKSNPKWTAVKPMIKSFLRSTLFLMNQVTETDILVFSLNQARASIPFFNAFPSLLRRLLKVPEVLSDQRSQCLSFMLSTSCYLDYPLICAFYVSDCPPVLGYRWR